MKGEFENRDREELGDLPETLGLERGELMRYGGAPGRVPADMRNNAASRQGADAAPIGTPQLDFDVRSVYDSRPVQGRDFNQWYAFVGEGVDEPGTFFAQAMRIPAGFVAVVRRIMYQTTPVIYTGISQNVMVVTKNGAVIMPEAWPVGVPAAGMTATNSIPISNGESVDTFIIADENETVGIILNPGLNINGNLSYAVGFYGNLLLKTGVPASMQVANYAGTKAPPRTVPNFHPSPEARTLRNKDPYKNVPLVGDNKMGRGRR